MLLKRALILIVALLPLARPANAGEPPLAPSTAGAPVDQPRSVASSTDLAQWMAWMQPCIRAARASYPEARERFQNGLPEGHLFEVAVRLRDSEAHIEQVFVRVVQVDGPLIQGWVNSDVSVVKGFSRGSAVWLADDEILDWVIIAPDGSETGNIIGKNLDRLHGTPNAGQHCRPVA